MLAAIVRKYGTDDRIEITNDDLAPVKGGLQRSIDPDTGTITWWFTRVEE